MIHLDLPDYRITIGPLENGALTDWLKEQAYAGLFIITDEHTDRHCLHHFLHQLPDGTRMYFSSIPSGELNKTLETCQKIWTDMFEGQVGRRWCAVNIGGGVVGDMGGFCAATFKRGMDFIQVPTTLLAQVDASVGGKLGIDFYGVKNSIGTFRNPKAVWIDPVYLQTLPAAELRSGYAEVIKHALIADPVIWQELRRYKNLATVEWQHIIPRSVSVKKRIVESDPHERGLRKALNFGHTIGHALESYFLETDRPLLHGEAVAIGMIAEAWLSYQLTGLTKQELEEIAFYLLTIFRHHALRPGPDTYHELIELMYQDKKNEDHRINFSLLDRVGSCVVNQTAGEELIRGALDYYEGLG